MEWIITGIWGIVGIVVYAALGILAVSWIQEQLIFLRKNPIYHDEDGPYEMMSECLKGLIMWISWPIVLIVTFLWIIYRGSQSWYSDHIAYGRSKWQDLQVMFRDWLGYWSAVWHESFRGPLEK